jgi:UTP-glucose-1-phosphate uridylyltransferase
MSTPPDEQAILRIEAATETNALTVAQLQDAIFSLLQSQTILSQGQIQLNDAVIQLIQKHSQLTDISAQLAEIQNNFDQSLWELKSGQERQERLLQYLVQKESQRERSESTSIKEEIAKDSPITE